VVSYTWNQKWFINVCNLLHIPIYNILNKNNANIDWFNRNKYELIEEETNQNNTHLVVFEFPVLHFIIYLSITITREEKRRSTTTITNSHSLLQTHTCFPFSNSNSILTVTDNRSHTHSTIHSLSYSR
jgi:hypothetical protein